MLVLRCWSFWQEMSNFYFSLENYPKWGPLDDFSHFLAGRNPTALLVFYMFITSSPLTRIIQTHRIVVFVYTDTFLPFLYILSANSIFSSYPAWSCCCSCCYHHQWCWCYFCLLFVLSFILIVILNMCVGYLHPCRSLHKFEGVPS